MSSYQELVAVLKEILTNRFYPKPEFIKGLLGDGLGNVVVPGRPDFNYVRFNRSANETFEVFNKEVSQPVDGTPVLIGVLPWQPGLVQVVGIDWESYIQTSWGNNYASIQAHAPTHEWPDFTPGSDYMRVFARAIYPLQGYGGGTGSMSFTAYPYQYDYTGTNSYWPGTPAVSLGPTRPPTGTMRYMGVYLNPATNQLGVVTGASVTFAADGEPPYPAWPLNVYPVAYARVYGGQAYFVERDIKDARRLWNTTLTYTGTSAGGGIAASQATVDAGTNNTEFVSPLKLRTTPHGIVKVKNTSGVTVTDGMVGHIDYIVGAGLEFRLTIASSADFASRAACVITGGANNADIYVVTRGRVTLTYTGTAPSLGDYLIFGSGGVVVRQTFMSAEVMAIAQAAGSGGLVDALLLTGTSAVVLAPTGNVMQVITASDSDFVATIATLPGGAILTYNAPSSGDENNIVPNATTHIAKMVLHNTTRGTNALISNSVAATNTTTLTDTVPAGWVVGDTITIRSQTNTAAPFTNCFYVEFEFVSDLNALTRFVEFYLILADTGASGQRMAFHPFQTNDGVKARTVRTQVSNQSNDIVPPPLPMIAKRFCMVWDASGTGTMLLTLRLTKEGIAVP